MKLPLSNIVFLVLGLCALALSPARAQFTRPNILITPQSCGRLSVFVSDSNAKDQGLADVELLFDPLGVYGHKIESYNVDFDGPQVDVTTGDLTAQFRIKVIDPLDTAYAAIWAINHSGVDNVVEWHYKPIGLQRQPNVLVMDTTLIGQSCCATLRLISNSDTSFTIDSVERRPGGLRFNFVDAPHTPVTLKKGDSFTIGVCYEAHDTTRVNDTIWLDMEGGCYRVPIPMTNKPIFPVIDATDLQFTAVDSGTTECKSLRVWNIGSAGLLATPTPVTGTFYFASTAGTYIEPNTYHDFSLCFSPDHYGQFQTDITWQTNMDPTYTAGFGKRVSHVIGISSQPGLHWDTTAGFYDPANGTAASIQFFVFNNAKTARHLDSIYFGGTDTTDFPIISNNYGNDLLQPGDSIEFTIAFRPGLFVTTVDRYSTAYIMSGGLRMDSLFLHGNTGQFASRSQPSPIRLSISIYPNPVSGPMLHVNSSDEIPRSATLLNLLGATVWQSDALESKEFEIPMSHVLPGEYFLRVTLAGRVETRKISIVDRR